MAALLQAAPPMTDPDFDRIRRIVHETCGLNLQPAKRVLVSSRLERLVRRHGCPSFAAYVSFVTGPKQKAEFNEFIDALTTNHTGFWREPEHFRFLREQILPGRKSPMRIWSAACSTGEEPYTIGMCALDAAVTNCQIFASDISQTVLHTAEAGVYSAAKLKDLPEGWNTKFFRQASDPGMSVVSRELRNLVDFRPVNLLTPFRQPGAFDVIFCRNVMIYFDQPTRDELVARFVAQIAIGGFLFTGHSETLLRLPPGLSYVRPAIYRRGK